MTLAERLSEFVRAAFTGLWVQSHEHDDAIVEVARLCRQLRPQLAGLRAGKTGQDFSGSLPIALCGPRTSQHIEGPSTSIIGTRSKPASNKIFAIV